MWRFLHFGHNLDVTRRAVEGSDAAAAAAAAVAGHNSEYRRDAFRTTQGYGALLAMAVTLCHWSHRRPAPHQCSAVLLLVAASGHGVVVCATAVLVCLVH